ncbi:hypothetical protein HYW60_00095 [Candidatus Kaiserbacteria bacterium]|nr:hypothetical protein [Candidatus Kaiserbacteria bacterium]
MKSLLFRCVVAAIALTCVGAPYSARAGDPVEVYRQGEQLDFGLAEKRFACRNFQLVTDFVTSVRDKFGGDKGLEMLWSPVQRVSNDGTLVLSPELEAKLPDLAEAVHNFCITAPPKVIVLGAFDYIKVGKTDEAVVTLVLDSHGQAWALYYLNIRVVTPLPGSEDAKRYGAILDFLAAPSAQEH